MKLASSSASYRSAIAAGRLTQLEWLDLCASDLALDGVLFDATDFPRTDADYAAQLKKMATDLGLTVAGLVCNITVESDEIPANAAAEHWIAVAWELGAPVVVTKAWDAAGSSDWNTLVAVNKGWAAEAKRRNVTLTVRNAAATLCASVADLKRLAKDVDSSWLRFALDIAALDPPESVADILPKTVIALHDCEAVKGRSDERLRQTVEQLEPFRGFFVIDDAAGDEATLASTVLTVRALIG
ncbi:MAG: TIM barrel protein [Candidatus Eremiobacteraeota bacterium]|nr:TIM barrel protein [Candidatus Eremiobacteraeota bacterium]